MTSTDARPDPEVWGKVSELYRLLGLTTLTDALDSGSIYDHPGPELASYARVAAVHWHGAPLVVAGIDGHKALREHFVLSLIAITTGKGLRHRSSGDAEIRSIEGEWTTLTPKMTQHIEWMVELMTWPAVAERFLEAMPLHVKHQAGEQVDTTWDLAFLAAVSDA